MPETRQETGKMPVLPRCPKLGRKLARCQFYQDARSTDRVKLNLKRSHD
ncbi:MAG: hypothetical protein F6K59_07125 [Moorea sp. SIO3F7]|nr:hypothetical protein [Moorena sp. SIO4A3]NEP98725.1 hypothetical protein [Moorena sp. SIO3F7]